MAFCVKKVLVFVVSLGALPHETSAGLFPNSTHVLELREDAFEAAVISSHQVWFVDFYASWCPHCQNFAPTWDRIASEYATDASTVSFGAMDCAVFDNFCSGIGIDGYPQLRSYNIPGRPETFNNKSGHSFMPGESNEGSVKTLLEKELSSLAPTGVPAAAGASSPLKPQSPSEAPAPAPAPKFAPASEASAKLRLADAEVALVYSLRQGTALAPLRGETLVELVAWLRFLAQGFPSAKAQRVLQSWAKVASDAQEATGELRRQDWLEALEAQMLDMIPATAAKDPQSHWRLCATYTCGLWTLFHVLLVSAAKDNNSSVALPSAAFALERIRGFVAHFFGCKECAHNFLETYDSCALGRCNSTSVGRLDASVWLWQVHNGVTLRVAAEQGRPKPELWPSSSECPRCNLVAGAGNWDNQSILEYLETAYGQPYDPSSGWTLPSDQVVSGITSTADGLAIRAARRPTLKTGAFAESIRGTTDAAVDGSVSGKKKSKEQPDFYRFQLREKRREDIVDHRKRNADDMETVKQMRKSKRFKVSSES